MPKAARDFPAHAPASQSEMPMPSATPDYELYLVRRLGEEQARAEDCDDALERAIHLQACNYYRDMLTPAQLSDDDAPDLPDSIDGP